METKMYYPPMEVTKGPVKVLYFYTAYPAHKYKLPNTESCFNNDDKCCSCVREGFRCCKCFA